MYDDLHLTLQNELPVDVDLGITAEIELSLGEGSSPFPYYEGDYYVIPRKVEQVLETKNKSMREDVTINAINYSETINPQGGNTVVIGYE